MSTQVPQSKVKEGVLKNAKALTSIPSNPILVDKFSPWIYQLMTPGKTPTVACTDGYFIYVVNTASNQILKYKLTGVLAATFTIPATSAGNATPSCICYDGNNLWVSVTYYNGTYYNSALLQMRCYDGTILNSISPIYATGALKNVITDGINIYATDYNLTGYLYAYNASTGLPVSIGSKTTPIPFTRPNIMCYTGSDLWVVNDAHSTTLTRLSLTTGNTVISFPSASKINSVCFDGTSVWMVTSSRLYSINISTNVPSNTYNFNNGATLTAVRSDGTNIWVTDTNNYVTMFDSTGTTILKQWIVDVGPSFLTYDGNAMWVSSSSASVLTRITV